MTEREREQELARLRREFAELRAARNAADLRDLHALLTLVRDTPAADPVAA